MSQRNNVKCCILLISILGVVMSVAAKDGSTTRTDESGSPQDFDKLVFDLAEKVANLDVKPTVLNAALVQRLEEHRRVSTETVLRAVHAEVSYESKSQGDIAPHLFPETKQSIDSILPLISNDERTSGALYYEKALLLDQEGNSKEAIAAAGQASSIISKLSVEVSLERLQYLLKDGEINEHSGYKKAAERAFREVLTFEWYLLDDPIDQRRARELYIQAGSGLIRVLRYDLKSLQELSFVPSTMNELRPELDKSIEEAKENGKKITADK